MIAALYGSLFNYHGELPMPIRPKLTLFQAFKGIFYPVVLYKNPDMMQLVSIIQAFQSLATSKAAVISGKFMLKKTIQMTIIYNVLDL